MNGADESSNGLDFEKEITVFKESEKNFRIVYIARENFNRR